jgi:D-3-phosphoglycerate dehydrogenase
LTDRSMTAFEILYEGTAAALNTRALTQAALAGLLKPALADVNMVNAPILAKERGIKVSETRRDQQGVYEGYMQIAVTTESLKRSVAGTVFSNGRPRLIQIKNIDLDSEFAPHMLYVTNEDKPGFIGRLGTLLGEAAVNIANFNLGRSGPGQDAIALVAVDGPIGEDVLTKIRKLPLVNQAKALAF